MAAAPRSGSTASAVWPAGSRAINAGPCSAESPRRLARSPRRWGRRSRGSSARCHRRDPLYERRKKVSSASTTPASASRAASGALRKRCRQRKQVVMCTPQCAAARTSVMPAASASPYASQHSFLRSRAPEPPPYREPAPLLAQPRQGGAGQGVEGLAAGRAAVAAQAAGVAPPLQGRRGTVRAARCGEERFLEQPYRLALARRRRQGPSERRPLLQTEPLDQVQQCREIGLAHHPPPPASLYRWSRSQQPAREEPSLF